MTWILGLVHNQRISCLSLNWKNPFLTWPFTPLLISMGCPIGSDVREVFFRLFSEDKWPSALGGTGYHLEGLFCLEKREIEFWTNGCF